MYRNLFSSTLVAVAAMACFSFADNSDPSAIPATLAKVDGVYQIGTCGDLYKFAQMANGGDYSISGKLTANIVVNEGLLDYVNKEDASFDSDAYRANHNGAEPKAWTPIGKYWAPFNDDGNFRAFNGILNGDGWTVSGLYFNDPSADYVGLVGYLSVRGTDEDYRVENVGVVESYFYGRNAVGGVFGTSSGYISYVYNTGLVKGSSYVGGVAGADCLVFEETLDDLELYENSFEWSELYNAYYDASVASVAAGYWNDAEGSSSEQFTDGTVKTSA